jgi:hypothetical protein
MRPVLKEEAVGKVLCPQRPTFEETGAEVTGLR